MHPSKNMLFINWACSGWSSRAKLNTSKLPTQTQCIWSQIFWVIMTNLRRQSYPLFKWKFKQHLASRGSVSSTGWTLELTLEASVSLCSTPKFIKFCFARSTLTHVHFRYDGRNGRCMPFRSTNSTFNVPHCSADQIRKLQLLSSLKYAKSSC